MTIKQVAKLTGISEQSLNELELGKKNFSMSTLRKLSAVLQKPISYLGCYENLPENTLGQQIKKARLYHGLTKSEFAQALGVSEKTIRLWENDLVEPSEQNLNVLRQYLSVLKMPGQ